ncbi:MAG: glycosyltransferase [Clostridia bacterium]|nr:glycosyltransferase [Clostridia bacterium]
MEKTMPKVSIVVPIYNVERYLRQCLDSIANQTLKDIEVICVNDGSKDSSLDIIMEYVNSDPRFKVIDKANSGYGDSMNRGFDMAQGEYIGIVESDDYAELDMFEKLYTCAKENDLDACKSGFFFYYSVPEEKNIPYPIASHVMCKRVFCPTTDFKSLREQVEFFNIKPTIWSAIYRKDFIRENQIRFTQTPGASFQDTAFNFKVWALAKRVKLLEDCFLHYRQDNENSSINSSAKVYCVCDEYAEIEVFLSLHPQLRGKLDIVKNALKYNTYIWNYERLSPDVAREFLLHASEEFKRDMLEGMCLKEAYPWYKWNNLNFIIEDPEGFHRMRHAEKVNEVYVPEPQRRESLFKRGIRCIKENGLIYTIKLIFRKLRRRLRRR